MPREDFTPQACIAGRALLGWTAEDLAARAHIATLTVEGFESRRRQPRYKTVTALMRAFANAGVVFSPEPPGAFRRPAEARPVSVRNLNASGE